MKNNYSKVNADKLEYCMEIGELKLKIESLEEEKRVRCAGGEGFIHVPQYKDLCHQLNAKEIEVERLKY